MGLPTDCVKNYRKYFLIFAKFICHLETQGGHFWFVPGLTFRFPVQVTFRQTIKVVKITLILLKLLALCVFLHHGVSGAIWLIFHISNLSHLIFLQRPAWFWWLLHILLSLRGWHIRGTYPPIPGQQSVPSWSLSHLSQTLVLWLHDKDKFPPLHLAACSGL